MELANIDADRSQVPEPLEGADPVAIASGLLRARRLRAEFFDASLFASPGWDLMLDLYTAPHEGRSVTISAACEAAGVPYATGHRWLNTLEAGGHVRRLRADGRTVHVELTAKARDRLTDLLLRIASLLDR